MYLRIAPRLPNRGCEPRFGVTEPNFVPEGTAANGPFVCAVTLSSPPSKTKGHHKICGGLGVANGINGMIY